jgi:peptide deformylase
LIIWPDSRLRIPSQKVTDFNDEFKQLCIDLADSLKYYSGQGLSAIQLGFPKRVFVMWVNEGVLTLVNPEWTPTSNVKTLVPEGCLSIPGYTAPMDRYREVSVKFQDENGKEFIDTFQDINAQTIQHESMHLEGKLFIDILSRMRREMLRKKLIKMKKNPSKYAKQMQEVSQ